MALLTVTKNYQDGDVLLEADLDAMKSSIENFLNVTRLNDDNLQDDGITGSTKLVAASVTQSKLAANAVSTAKIVDSAVTTAKIADMAVTTVKLATLAQTLPAGSITMFHTFNGAVSVPRGWMKCNGNLIDATNYEAIHGAGTYTTDAISTSALNGRYLPNLVDRYPIGVSSTTQSGASAITEVGNASSQINLAHSHTVDSHTHSISNSIATGPAGSGVTRFVRDTSAFASSTGGSSPGTSVSLSTTQSIKPASIEVVFIMRVI